MVVVGRGKETKTCVEQLDKCCTEEMKTPEVGLKQRRKIKIQEGWAISMRLTTTGRGLNVLPRASDMKKHAKNANIRCMYGCM